MPQLPDTTDTTDTVDSVHRYPNGSRRTGAALARLYWAWLDGAWGPFVAVSVRPDAVFIRLMGLTAIHLGATSPGDYEVRGGLLARPGGRLRFHATAALAVAALLDFRPTLPVWLYRRTHGPIHEHTMRRFGRHLARLDEHLEESHA